MPLFVEGFLSRVEKDRLADWKPLGEDKSVLCKTFESFYRWLAQLIPPTVSPNILSLLGLLCSLLAWEWSFRDNLDQIDLLCVASFLLSCLLLDKVDGIHARATYNDSPLGELIEQWSVCVSVTFVTVTICNLFGLDDWRLPWMVVMCNGMSMSRHLHTFTHPALTVHAGHFTRTGPTERFLLLIVAVVFRDVWWHGYVPSLIFKITMCLGGVCVVQMIYWAVHFYQVTKDYSTLFGIILCFAVQLLKLLRAQRLNLPVNPVLFSIEEGLVFSTLCGDLILAKMAKRQLHPLVPVLHLVSVCYEHASIPLALLYFAVNVLDVAHHLKLSVFNPVRNLLVTGYYDGLHEGHVASLVRASRYGNRLTVGVHSDEEYNRTKFDPKKNNALMHKLIARCAAAAKVPCVDEVIPSAPVTLDPEFLHQHRVHAVGISDEYVYETDPKTGKITKCHHTYAPVMDWLVIVPRTQGFSSTEIRQVQASAFEEFRKIEQLVLQVKEQVGKVVKSTDVSEQKNDHKITNQRLDTNDSRATVLQPGIPTESTEETTPTATRRANKQNGDAL